VVAGAMPDVRSPGPGCKQVNGDIAADSQPLRDLVS